MGDQNFKSLNTFLDVVLALVFLRMIEFLPAFEDKHWIHLPYGLFSLLASDPANLTRIVFGVIIIVYYWNRKNTLLSVVDKSNGAFATLSVASLFFVCLFMYALVADPTYIGGPPTLLLQSLSLFAASLLGFFALRYAIHAGLVRPEMKLTAEKMTRVDLRNPLTAAIAAGLSWSGLTIWTLSWFVLMPLFSALLTKRTTHHLVPRCAHLLSERRASRGC
ncbi:MAG: hypothetical protein ACXVAM_07355 [Vulcanimicrobiaceae bacterium]